MHRFAVVAISVLLASACASADDRADADAAATASSGASSAPSTTLPPTVDVTTTEVPSDSPGPPAPGVSDDRVQIGVLMLDYDVLAALGYSGSAGDVEGFWRGLISEVNDAGGVHGRQIVPVFHPLLPTPGESETACIELTEDHEVFAVMGPILPEGVGCFTEIRSTPFISPWVLTADVFERAEAPVVAIGASATRLMAGLVRLLDSRGELADRRMAVVARADNARELDAMLAALGEVDADVGDDTIVDAERSDALAIGSALDRAVERWRVADVDTVVVVGGLSTQVAQALERTGFDADLVLTSGDGVVASAYFDQGVSPETLHGAIGLGTAPELAAYEEDPSLRSCIDGAAATGGVTIEIEMTDGALSELRSAIEACQVFAVFVAALEAAGPILDVSTLRAGLASLDPIELPGVAAASIGPDKFDLSDDFWLYRFDEATETFVVDGEPLVAVDP